FDDLNVRVWFARFVRNAQWCGCVTSSLGRHTYVGSKSLVRFCCDFLNLRHLAKSAISEPIPPNEAQTRQVSHLCATGIGGKRPLSDTGHASVSVGALELERHPALDMFRIFWSQTDRQS